MQSDSPHFTNRLSRESSPYLLQHQHNPVDWYPWGEEAFEVARKTDRPIFLSVGYSTCYWCHVMERECFENEAIAKLMNDHLVCIKVDREERPDVDQLYMAAVQIMTRQGGWPMSSFLFADGRPFYGGTYFPPRDAHGRPGFPTLIRAIDDAWKNRRDEMSQSADEVISIVKQLARPSSTAHAITVDNEWVDSLIFRSVADFDPNNGGFGSAPKFPRETLLELLLTYLRVRGTEAQPNIAQILRRTLTALADGGIRDHLGGGFHRYSTDEHWLVPHFEIMLYDNALLAWCFAEASVLLNEPRFGQVADRICGFVLREMTSPDGAFYSAIDAEVDAHEGASYLWTTKQVKESLGERFEKSEIDLFLTTFGLDLGPNFADPHHDHGVVRTNVLFLPKGPAGESDPILIQMREHLYSLRRNRKQPGTDTKIITSWNALMIRGLWKTGMVLNRVEYQSAAKQAARYLMKKHRDNGGQLLRISRDNVAKQPAFLDDYADLAKALAEMGHPEFREDLDSLWRTMESKFAGKDGGYFFTEARAGDLLIRQMLASDSPLPSGNASAALTALALGDISAVEKTLRTFAGQLQHQAEGMSSLLQAALLYLSDHPAFAVTPSSGASAPSPEELAHQAVVVSADWSSDRQIIVELKIADGYHLNAHDVSEPLVPTELRIHTGGNIEKQIYPAAHAVRVGESEAISIYQGTVQLSVVFQRPPSVGVQMTLRYQPCTDTACLPVVSHSFELLPIKPL